MKKGVMTTSILTKELARQMNISDKQSSLLVDSFIDALNIATNYTDSLGVKIGNFGTLIIRENQINSLLKSNESKLAKTEDKDVILDLEKRIDCLLNKRRNLNKIKNNRKGLANVFPSLLKKIIDFSRLNKTEIAEKQNEYKQYKENKQG